MNEKYGKRLLNAQSEAEVTAIIDDLEAEVDVEWVPHGNERNYNAVYGNTPNPAGAFAELPMNSIDAILTKRYRQVYGEKYHPSHGLTSVQKAVDDLWGDEPIDEEIEVIADGPTDDGSATAAPNIIVRDTGEGQPPEHFEDRFLQLSTGSQKKDEWPFTQGRFKMGAGAVLRHSGGRGYKLVLSAGFRSAGTWSWSLIRDNSQEGYFEYLRIKGLGVPTFTGEVRGQRSGTFVKVYEYRYGSTRKRWSTILTQDALRDRVDRVLVEPAVQIQYNETRDLSADVGTALSGGIIGQLDQGGRRTDAVRLIDESFPWDFGEPLGTLPVRLVVFKNNRQIDAHNEKYDPTRTDEFGVKASKTRKGYFVGGERHGEQAVLYAVNGQTHARERKTFLTGSRRCSLSNVGKDMLAIVDLSEFGDKQQHTRGAFLKLFTPSRDRLSEEPIANQLRDGLEAAIGACDPVQDEEDRRRRERAQRETDRVSKQTLRDLVSGDRTLIEFLTTGALDVAIPAGLNSLMAVPYQADFYPSRLAIIEREHRDGAVDLWDANNGTYQKEYELHESNVGSAPRVKFDLDAPNDYFERSKNPGELLADGGAATAHPSVRGYQLRDGVLTMNLDAPEDAIVGDRETIEVTVTRELGDDLTDSFEVEYIEPVSTTVPPEESGTQSTPERRTRTDVPELPEPIQVYREDWEDDTPPWTADEPVRMDVYDDGLDIYVNMDHSAMTAFKDRHDLRPRGKETLEAKWTAGIALNTLVAFAILDDAEDDFGGLPPEDVAALVMRGVSMSLLNLSFGEEELKSMTY